MSSVIGITVGTPLNIDPLSARVSRNDKRITNLEQGIIPDPFETDASLAYIKNVPANALPYAEVSKVGGMIYYDDVVDMLFNAKVTEIESVGINIIPFPYQRENTVTLKGVTFTINSDGSVTANGTATDVVYYNIADVYYEAGNYYTLSGAPIEIEKIGYLYDDTEKMYDYGNGATKYFENGATGKIYICIRQGAVVSNLTFSPMLHKGKTALSYMPYRKHTLQIPEAVQTLDGYGVGIDNTCYNYIDWENRVFVKRVGNVDMGTLTWRYDSTYAVFTATIEAMKPNSMSLLCAKYNLSPIADSVKAPDLSIYGRSVNASGERLGSIGLKDSNYTTAESLSTNVSGCILYYELATPEVTDISNVLPSDNFIGIEGGGTITAIQKWGYDYDVPSEITYMLKGE